MIFSCSAECCVHYPLTQSDISDGYRLRESRPGSPLFKIHSEYTQCLIDEVKNVVSYHDPRQLTPFAVNLTWSRDVSLRNSGLALYARRWVTGEISDTETHHSQVSASPLKPRLPWQQQELRTSLDLLARASGCQGASWVAISLSLPPIRRERVCVCVCYTVTASSHKPLQQQQWLMNCLYVCDYWSDLITRPKRSHCFRFTAQRHESIRNRSAREKSCESAAHSGYCFLCCRCFSLFVVVLHLCRPFACLWGHFSSLCGRFASVRLFGVFFFQSVWGCSAPLTDQ